MVSSVRTTVQLVGDRVVDPKASPPGAWTTILTRLADSSLAAVRVKNVGCPVGNVFGLISSWAEAAVAQATMAAAATATTRAERRRSKRSPSAQPPAAPARSLN